MKFELGPFRLRLNYDARCGREANVNNQAIDRSVLLTDFVVLALCKLMINKDYLICPGLFMPVNLRGWLP